MNKNTISNVLMAAALGTLAVFSSALIENQTARAQGSATVGSLRGVIRDKADGQPAVGATVVATSPALQGEQVVITEDTGQYFVTSLPPGVYTLTVYYNDAKFSRDEVLIQIGKEAVVNITVTGLAATGKPKGEIIEVQGAAPIVDQGSTKTGLTITDDYTRNIPVARTFGGVIGAAAGAQADFYGISLAGSTSSENVYIVEGINTTDTAYGGLSSNLPNEFISETEVITGGYNAEFGRATGGIINVVTKQGSNEYHGSVYGYYRPGAFVSDAKVIQHEGGSIDTANNLDYQFDLGGELGGPIIEDKLWFHVGFNPSLEKQTTTRYVQTQIDTDNDGVADVDPDNGFTIHRPVSQSDIPREEQTYYFTAKLNGAVDQNNQFQISAFGNPSSRDDLLEHSSIVTRNPDQTRWHVAEGAYDVSGKWTSKLNSGKTQIDGVLGYHRGFRREGTLDGDLGVQDQPWVYYNYERSLYDFADLEGPMRISACQDDTASDPYPEIVNCPVSDYAEGGLSFLERRTNARTSGTVSITQRVKLAGYHVFKAGLDGEFATYDATNRYTGAQRWRRSEDTATGAPGRWQLREFYQFERILNPDENPRMVEDNLGPGEQLCAEDRAVCKRADAQVASTTNRTLGAFLQDSWQIRPNLTLNAGLRYEQQVGYVADELAGKTSPEGETVPDRAYELNNLIAPRIGFIFDPTREGKSKLYGHYGRFYENVPMDLNVRAFGGEILNFNTYNFGRRTPGASNYDPNCDVDHTSGETSAALVAQLSQCSDTQHQAILGGGYEYVSPGLQGQRTDEIILGAEYELLSNLTIGANYVHRTLPVVIEDISVDGGNTYLITNPGLDFTDEAAKLQTEADRLLASPSESDQALGEVYDNRAKQMAYVNKLQKPIRDYDAVQLLARQRPSPKSLLQASYTYSQSRGNYPGLFSTETLQLDPNLTSLYDLPELMGNRYGKLGLDRPHNVKIDGFYLFDLKKNGQIVAGGSFRAQSGIPHNALAAHVIYGDRESYLLPRGAMPRSPVTSQLDVRLAYGYRVSKNTTLEGFVNVFNLFDQQDQLDTDEEYTLDAAQPVIGGDMTDLKHVKQLDTATGTEVNSTVKQKKNFGNTTTRTSPRNFQLGFRLTF